MMTPNNVVLNNPIKQLLPRFLYAQLEHFILVDSMHVYPILCKALFQLSNQLSLWFVAREVEAEAAVVEETPVLVENGFQNKIVAQLLIRLVFDKYRISIRKYKDYKLFPIASYNSFPCPLSVTTPLALLLKAMSSIRESFFTVLSGIVNR